MFSFVIAANPLQRVTILALTALTFVTLTGCGTPGSTVGRATSIAAVPLTSVLKPPILLFIGTGTSASDVAAVETILGAKKLTYSTANSSQLNALTEAQLKAYKLLIVPGGNSITIGPNIS